PAHAAAHEARKLKPTAAYRQPAPSNPASPTRFLKKSSPLSACLAPVLSLQLVVETIRTTTYCGRNQKERYQPTTAGMPTTTTIQNTNLPSKGSHLTLQEPSCRPPLSLSPGQKP